MSELFGISIVIAMLMAGFFAHKKKRLPRITIGKGIVVKRKQS